jgi:tRNA uridine 5-carboxymethylaminomethyl modification enzyme
MNPLYDIIVVGAGHAGCEAAAAAANMGSTVLLITMNMNTIAQMSCNPAVGGIAKGQIVREIDALGGYSGLVSDRSAIQFRMLNRSKGPAMWSPRCQSDRMRFSEEWRLMLEATPNVDFLQEMVKDLMVENNRVTGVITSMGSKISAKTVVLTNGTFLNGIIHIGEKQLSGGRTAEKAATGITEQLISLGFQAGRMKTGTPPRIDGRSLDYSKMEEQKGDENPGKFSFLPSVRLTEQRSCWVTYTNSRVHEVLQTGFEKSPMFQGRIQGLGPRYCPSIEDKITRFAERDRHQIFVEPEGWKTVEVYVNGFSTSLPEEVQQEAIRLIPGFERAKLFRPGYAIEYDFFPPTQLNFSLETKAVEGLFFAGQINGTTGYEEAACQGLMAGINAHQKCINEAPLVLKRNEAYIGVLIDDLVTKGTDEPYRMFTSRAEYRILLRQDNADARLTPIGHSIGLAKSERMELLEKKNRGIDAVQRYLRNTSVEPEEVNPWLVSISSAALPHKAKAHTLISRPNISLSDLGQFPCLSELNTWDEETLVEAEIQIKYSGYLERERDLAEKHLKLEGVPLPHGINYSAIKSLSSEAKEKLTKAMPTNLGQASRISGITPADISVLLVYMGRH